MKKIDLGNDVKLKVPDKAEYMVAVLLDDGRTSSQLHGHALNLMGLACSTVVEKVRAGCPVITNGTDEDMLSLSVASKILTDDKLYKILKAL